jgi:hypothetical protein
MIYRSLLISTCLASLCFGTSVVIGVNNDLNIFPFGGPVAGAGTRYQQAYASADFTGPITITGIDFFGAAVGQPYYSGTYTLSLSTITAGIDTLSTTNFDANVGPDNQLFAVSPISGTQPDNTTLTFTGAPFLYNPANGNLLLDIQISGANGTFAGASFEADDSATGIFSRYQDFGAGFTGIGLVTEFDFTATPEPGSLVFLGCGLLAIALRFARCPNRAA